ncbi:MAG: serine protease [Deltaproteobacteria bacterium]|nr:serine protease [Deltaproteobacteria bacterium]
MSPSHLSTVYILVGTLLAGCTLTPPPAIADTASPSKADNAAESQEPAEPQPRASAAQPTIEILGTTPEEAWVRPTFVTTDQPLSAGTAFVCEVVPGQPPLLLSAQHLFGPAGGLAREYAWSEMKTLVQGAEGYDAHGNRVVTAGPPLTIEGAEAMSEERVDADIAAFPLLAPTRVHALPLASAMPTNGDPVWLVAEVMGAAPSTLRHRATIQEVAPTHLVYVFDDAIELRATSGAPVINAAGQVVAINLGGGDEGGKTFGIGNPAPSILARVRSARGD